jgi:hypothetical protein
MVQLLIVQEHSIGGGGDRCFPWYGNPWYAMLCLTSARLSLLAAAGRSR